MNDEEQKKIFSKNLRKYVENSGKQQNDICRDIGVKTTTFNMWIKGNTMPNVSKIQMLADYFHIGKSDLVDEKPEAPEFNEDHIEMIQIYDSLPKSEQDKMMQIIRLLSGAAGVTEIVKKERDE